MEKRYREGGWRVSGLHWSLRPCSSLCSCVSSLNLLVFSFQILLKLSLDSVKLFWGGKLWYTLDKVQPIWGYITCSHIRDSCKIVFKNNMILGGHVPGIGVEDHCNEPGINRRVSKINNKTWYWFPFQDPPIKLQQFCVHNVGRTTQSMIEPDIKNGFNPKEKYEG